MKTNHSTDFSCNLWQSRQNRYRLRQSISALWAQGEIWRKPFKREIFCNQKFNSRTTESGRKIESDQKTRDSIAWYEARVISLVTGPRARVIEIIWPAKEAKSFTGTGLARSSKEIMLAVQSFNLVFLSSGTKKRSDVELIKRSKNLISWDGCHTHFVLLGTKPLRAMVSWTKARFETAVRWHWETISPSSM